MTDKIVVLTTCAAASDAERMARALVDGRVAACVNVVPGVRSFYHWKGETQSSEEFLLIVKTSRDLFGALRAEMEKLHPYELPELLALPVVAGAENRSEEHTSELQSLRHLLCRLLLEKKNGRGKDRGVRLGVCRAGRGRPRGVVL